MKKVVIVGALWTSNFGDVLLAKLMKEKLESLDCIVSFPNASEAVLKELQHDSEQFDVKDADYVIFCGGGYFSEPPGNSVKWAISRYKLLFKYATKCRISNTPYSILGVGAGPVNSAIAKLIIKHVCMGAQRLAVRDKISFDTIKQLTSRDDITLVADHVMTKSRVINQEVITEEHKKIGFHLTVNGRAVIPTVIEFIKENQDVIYPIFIEDHKGEFERVSQLYPELKSLFRDKVYKYEGVDSFIEHLDRLAMVVTSKLHVGIVAATLGKSICSLPYHAKVERLYQELGRSEVFFNDFSNEKEFRSHLDKSLNFKPVIIPKNILDRAKEIEFIVERLVK